MKKFPIEPLKRWFQMNRRDLPWRENPTPYAVWISEMMLQQTQVDVVIPYFERWIKRFPDVPALGAASLDEVIKAWEGLGYYSRARYLHEGARYVNAHFNGHLPNEEEDLKKIKGLGPYTLGAIRSFAFHQKASAVDGNVIRVIARYFAIEEDISKPKTVNAIRQIVEGFLPEEESWIVNEALIELGATVCKRNPQCNKCPLQGTCKAHSQGMAQKLPVKTTKTKTEFLYRAVAIIKSGDHFLLRRGKKGAIMSDLYEFPYFEVEKEGVSVEKLTKIVKKELELSVKSIEALAAETHSFTRYQVRLDPVIFNCVSKKVFNDYEWHSEENLRNLAFSSGHRRILNQLFNL